MRSAAFPLLKMTAIIIHNRTLKIVAHAKLHNFQHDSWDVGLKGLKNFSLNFIESEIDKNVNHNDWVTKEANTDNVLIVISKVKQVT